MSGIDFRYLKAFSLTAKYLNFSRAAEELHIAQSAVSRQIKLLEESLGEQLIARSSKRVLLTDKGKSLYRAVQRFEEMTAELAASSGPRLIKVGILHGLLENWFIKVVKDFNKKSKHLLKIETDTPANLKRGLLDGKYDLIFTTENIQSELAASLFLFKEELAIIFKKSSKTSKDPTTKELLKGNWIVYNETDFLYELAKKELGKEKPGKVLTVKSLTSIIKLVKESAGTAIVPSHAVSKEKGIEIRPVKGLQAPRIHMSSLNYRKLPAHLEELAEVVQKSL